MGKRKHGKMTVPMSFSTRHFTLLSRQENRSAYIDRAIEHYDKTVNWRHRAGKTELEARAENMKSLLASALKEARWLDDNLPDDFIDDLANISEIAEDWNIVLRKWDR